MVGKLKGYCHQCKSPCRTGYCRGTTENPHPPEPVPPCVGCTGPCNYAAGRGCKRFTILPKHRDKSMVSEGREWAVSKRTILSESEGKQITAIGRLFDRLFGKGNT